MSPVYEANIMRRKNATMARQTMATVSWRNRRHARAQSPGDSRTMACGGLLRTALMGGSLLERHARVDQLVHHVDQQVDEHGDHGEVDSHRLDPVSYTHLRAHETGR